MNKTYVFYYILISIMIITLSTPTHAAIIKGTVYDLGLTQESNVHIEIDTVPHQIFIAKNGTYMFNVPQGNYTLHAKTIDGYANESVIVDTDGEYLLDIVLEPMIDRPVVIDTELDTTPNTPSTAWIYLMGAIIIVIIIIGGIIIMQQKIKKHSHHHPKEAHHQTTHIAQEPKHEHAHTASVLITDEYGMQVLRIIKKDKRITQKDLRKQIPLSEGKVSLIISELEHEGKIKKIKKGRGNILVFVKE